jgi:hypothetical protein
MGVAGAGGCLAAATNLAGIQCGTLCRKRQPVGWSDGWIFAWGGADEILATKPSEGLDFGAVGKVSKWVLVTV